MRHSGILASIYVPADNVPAISEHGTSLDLTQVLFVLVSIFPLLPKEF